MGGAAAEEVKVEVAPGGKEEEIDFSKITIDEAFKVLQASHHGLTSDDVTKRIAEYGYNKLPESSRSMVLVFLGYMWNPLSWAMESAAIIAIALLDYADFALIVGLLLLNAIISFVEESSADKAIKALTAALAPKAKALRDGQVQSIDAVNLVPGDIIIMRLGDIVPADVKILGEEGGGEGEETPMQIDQAALTGESLPAKKFTSDVAFSGSTVKQGERHCVVYATGVNTFFGRAAALISATNNVANLQRVMNKVSAICLITIGVWVVIELAVQFGHYDHACYSGQGGCPTLVNMLVIIVGGIPIAMPTVLSVTLALGAYALAKEGAIVARMSAVEEMAGMDVLCSDKTGTLTLNKLSVETTSIVPLGSFAINDVLLYACLSANIVTEEPIDVVLYNCYPDVASLKDTHKMVKFVPFNPTDKFTAATIQELKTGRTFRLLKGSPQVVVRRCHNFSEISQVVNNAVVSYANRGFRSLGLALAEGDGPVDSANTKWEMVGVIPMFDPPRHDTKAVVEQCFAQGIRVKMITGDHLLIGIETAKMLGMGHEMFTAEKLLKAKTGDKASLGKYKDATEMVETANGFAEVFPEHKFEIVQILQDADHIVGMTGDGVNDAPALKKADVGIAVAGATDAARGAADIVLTEAGLGAISTAVVGARKIFQRMTTYSKYTVAMTFRICFTFGLLTVIYDWYFPTILIVLLAVFNDGAMIALSKDKVVASPVPNSWNLRNIFIMGIVYGLYLTLSSWAMYQTAVKTSFFHDKFNLPDLDDRYSTLQAWCTNYLEVQFPDLNANGLVTEVDTTQFPQFIPYVTAINDYTRRHVGDQVTFLAQCMAEQFYLRGAMMRTFLYVQVSISGQALVFVVRTQGHSLMERAGLATYIAFFAAQTGASLFGVFGFGGYEKPDAAIPDCQFCSYSNHEPAKFFRGYVPIAFTEPAFTASVVGCVGYVAVAWVWCMIWYVLLDPIKWALCWILNDDGFRDKKSAQENRAHQNALDRRSKEIAETQEVTVPGGGEAGYNNPLGRTSLTKPVGAALDKRQAAVMPVVRTSDGLVRVSTDPQRMHQLARRSLIGEVGPSPHQRTSLTKTSMQKKSHEIGPVAEGMELREVRTDL